MIMPQNSCNINDFHVVSMIIMHYQGEKSYVDVYTPHLSWFLDEDMIRSPGCLSNGMTPCELPHLLGLGRHPRQIHLTREYCFLRPVTDCESRPTLLLER